VSNRRQPVFFAAVVALGALLIAACGGSSGSPPPATTPTAGSPEAKPPATALDAKALEALAAEAVKAPLPSVGGDLLAISPNEEAGKQAAEALRAAGFDLTGATVLVLPIAGTNQSLLVMEFDATASASSSDAPDDPLPGLKALVDAPAIKAANVTRVVIITHGTDEKGSYVFTMTIPMTAVAAMTSGTLSSTDAIGQMTIDLEYGAR